MQKAKVYVEDRCFSVVPSTCKASRMVKNMRIDLALGFKSKCLARFDRELMQTAMRLCQVTGGFNFMTGHTGSVMCCSWYVEKDLYCMTESRCFIVEGN